MIKKVRTLFHSQDNKVLLNNFISLSALQGVGYLLPLLTLPYLVRVLGPEYFGLLAFVTSVMTYLMILTDYGFNLSATRNVAICSGDIDKISEIFNAVMIIKFLLMMVSFGLLSLFVFSVDYFYKNIELYYIAFTLVVGQVLFPVWLFQGMERMKYIAILTILSKLLFTVAVFVFVSKKADFYLVPLITGLGNIVSGTISLVFARQVLKIKFFWPSVRDTKRQFSDGWHVFLSGLAVSAYTTSSVFILGLLTSPVIVGYYSATEKIINSIHGLYQPLSQAIYPFVNKKFHESKEAGLKIIRRLITIVGGLMLMMSLGVFVFAEKIIFFVLGEDYHPAVLILKILSFSPFLVCLSNILGIQAMLSMGYKARFSRILICAGVIGIILSIVLVKYFGAVGSAATVVVVEGLVTFSMLLFLSKSEVNILNLKRG